MYQVILLGHGHYKVSVIRNEAKRKDFDDAGLVCALHNIAKF
jgi:hypothetical protein